MARTSTDVGVLSTTGALLTQLQLPQQLPQSHAIPRVRPLRSKWIEFEGLSIDNAFLRKFSRRQSSRGFWGSIRRSDIASSYQRHHFPSPGTQRSSSIVYPQVAASIDNSQTQEIRMELFMKDISRYATKHEVAREIAQVLHSPEYATHSPLPLNFHVRFFFNRNNKNFHKGTGALTLPTEELGNQFLRDYGERTGLKSLSVRDKVVKFKKSKYEAKSAIVEDIRRLPYQDSEAVEGQERRTQEIKSERISIQKLQFGWECRDHVFSSELEYNFSGIHQNHISLRPQDRFLTCHLVFDEEHREIRLNPRSFTESFIIAIRFSQIHWYSSNQSQSVIFFSLYTAPSYERETLGASNVKRQRQIALDSCHALVAPYTSLAIRVVCDDAAGVSDFRRLCRLVQLQSSSDVDYPIVRRGLFSSPGLEELEKWLLELDWSVAFQVQALVLGLVLDPTEMLSLRQKLDAILRERGVDYTSLLLRHFAIRAKASFDNESDDGAFESIEQCFTSSQEDYKIIAKANEQTPRTTDGVFDCLHVQVTPTTMILEGPFPERTNRVIRSYPNHHDCFLRVSFTDEDRLQYRFDRDVDGATFTRLRVGSILLKGLTVAGRPFKFLAYSQSALKEHAVWFVMDFFDLQTQSFVTASTIISSLGNFNNLEFDRTLQFCPARYGARVSQAFTATDASISVRAEEIFVNEDIKSPDGSWCFTDGVGTISPELARDVWQKHRAIRKRARRAKSYPRAIQVRFMGSKGMLSVNHKLIGRAVCLRPSMIKFEAPESREIEIAQAFDRPRKYFLNRPLIMILEHIGIPYESFLHFQEIAVKDAQESVESLGRAARLLESHGLGNSFRLTSVMLGLAKLGVEVWDSTFYNQMMEYAVHHVLRELKHRARIPIPGAWTLVGVADVHKFLKEGEIFACIKSPDGPDAIYLEGPVLISRSPTIHPGDVQIANAIGRPPPDSCFALEPLPNTVVFSVKGERPLPSCLGGGDLDGDEYNLIPLNILKSFIPKKTHMPGAYTAATRKLLDRPSTMDDVADFFVEYINSDVLGIIAINWMIIADQSQFGLDDPDCLKLAQLHSDAVDYPKSGQPVSLERIPKLKFRAKPDWNAPETSDRASANYYESQRAIGRLFRAIHLPNLRIGKRARRKHNQQDRSEMAMEDLLEAMHLDNNEDPIQIAVETRVSDFLDIHLSIDGGMMEAVSQLFNRYVLELQTICDSHSLFPHRSAMLSEEEAVIGTIVAKCSQPRRRKDLMARMRDLTDQLVRSIRDALSGDSESLDGALGRAWAAWKLSLVKGDTFGARSFGWVALGGIFEAIREIEEAVRGRT